MRVRRRRRQVQPKESSRRRRRFRALDHHVLRLLVVVIKCFGELLVHVGQRAAGFRRQRTVENLRRHGQGVSAHVDSDQRRRLDRRRSQSLEAARGVVSGGGCGELKLRRGGEPLDEVAEVDGVDLVHPRRRRRQRRHRLLPRLRRGLAYGVERRHVVWE